MASTGPPYYLNGGNEFLSTKVWDFYINSVRKPSDCSFPVPYNITCTVQTTCHQCCNAITASECRTKFELMQEGYCRLTEQQVTGLMWECNVMCIEWEFDSFIVKVLMLSNIQLHLQVTFE